MEAKILTIVVILSIGAVAIGLPVLEPDSWECDFYQNPRSEESGEFSYAHRTSVWCVSVLVTLAIKQPTVLTLESYDTSYDSDCLDDIILIFNSENKELSKNGSFCGKSTTPKHFHVYSDVTLIYIGANPSNAEGFKITWAPVRKSETRALAQGSTFSDLSSENSEIFSQVLLSQPNGTYSYNQTNHTFYERVLIQLQIEQPALFTLENYNIVDEWWYDGDGLTIFNSNNQDLTNAYYWTSTVPRHYLVNTDVILVFVADDLSAESEFTFSWAPIHGPAVTA